MASVIKRIQKRIKMTSDKYRSDRHFSRQYANLRLRDELGGRLGFRKVARNAHEKRVDWIRCYLKKCEAAVADAFQQDVDQGTYNTKAPIWVCWWTGEESAPNLVKQCIRSIRRHAGNHPVNLIDQTNYKQYVQIPDYMLEKVKKGDMGFAHLADYIRVSLLAEHGGLWLDATIFCSQDIPEDYFKLPFFTCKSKEQECGYVSRMRWVTFVLGGWKGNIVYRYLKAAFEEYWKNESVAIDYLFFDYIIELGYNEIPAVKQAFDTVPINNIHRDDLQAAMNAALPAERFEDVIRADTVLYKLSWRETYSMTTGDEKKSIFGKFLEEI